MDHPAETASVVAGNSSFQVSPFFDQVNKYKKKKKSKKEKGEEKENAGESNRSDAIGFRWLYVQTIFN